MVHSNILPKWMRLGRIIKVLSSQGTVWTLSLRRSLHHLMRTSVSIRSERREPWIRSSTSKTSRMFRRASVQGKTMALFAYSSKVLRASLCFSQSWTTKAIQMTKRVTMLKSHASHRLMPRIGCMRLTLVVITLVRWLRHSIEPLPPAQIVLNSPQRMQARSQPRAPSCQKRHVRISA